MSQVQAHTHSHGADHKHMTKEEALACCSHHEISIERWIVFTLIGGVLLLATTVARLLHLVPSEATGVVAEFVTSLRIDGSSVLIDLGPTTTGYRAEDADATHLVIEKCKGKVSDLEELAGKTPHH